MFSSSLSGYNWWGDYGIPYYVRDAYRILAAEYRPLMTGGTSRSYTGALGDYFLRDGGMWVRNGTENVRCAEDEVASGSGIVTLQPFMYDYAQPAMRRTSMYFRELTDEHDVVYSYEADYGFRWPAMPPWVSRTTVSSDDYILISIFPIYCVVASPIWKKSANNDRIWDDRRSWCICCIGDQYGGMEPFSREKYGMIGSVKDLAERVLSFARTYGSFDPSTLTLTKPYAEASSSGWSRCGYQVYVYPIAVFAYAQPRGRRNYGH